MHFDLDRGAEKHFNPANVFDKIRSENLNVNLYVKNPAGNFNGTSVIWLLIIGILNKTFVGIANNAAMLPHTWIRSGLNFLAILKK